MTVHHNPYSTVQELYSQLCTFERQVPFELRCRVALMALPSVYPDPELAKQDSPEVTRRHLHRTLHQYTIALNISEQILHLQRPYFVMAMHDQPVDPTRSIYGHSYLAVVERCNVSPDHPVSYVDTIGTRTGASISGTSLIHIVVRRRSLCKLWPRCTNFSQQSYRATGSSGQVDPPLF